MERWIDPKRIALRFNECINNRDLEGLTNLMTDDHTFIDNVNDRTVGKSQNKDIWAEFFRLFPDYRNLFDVVISKGSTVIILGKSLCSDPRLNGLQSIWTAQIAGKKVSEWRVWLDNEENRAELGL